MNINIEDHKNIKALIEEKGNVGICLSAEDIAEELNLSIDNVKTHLEIMCIDRFVAKPNNVDLYCNNSALVFMLRLLGYDVYLT